MSERVEEIESFCLENSNLGARNDLVQKIHLLGVDEICNHYA